ncbi:MAG: hypothetical protein GX295_00365 [Syntrophomonadaceae bacterium]|nr:hypothetical protein [Syntrophomonadaceae bacterium]
MEKQELLDLDPGMVLNHLGRRYIKVIGGPTLSSVEEKIKDWLQEGHYVRHLQIDHLPHQPFCERWQVIITYYINQHSIRPPKRKCYRCTEQKQCGRYANYVQNKLNG